MADGRLIGAQEKIRRGDKQAARQLLRIVLEDNPADSEAWVLMAQAMDKPEQAAYCLKQALKLDSGHLAAGEWLTYILEHNQMPDFSSDGSVPHWLTTDILLDEGSSDPEQMHQGQIKMRIVELFGELVREIEPLDPELYDLPHRWTWQSDENGNYIVCSPEVYDILGVRSEEFLGQPYKSYRLAPNSRVALDFFIKSGLFPFEVPIYFMSATDNLIPVYFSVDVRTEAGEKKGWQGTAEIITSGEREIDEIEIASPVIEENVVTQDQVVIQDSGFKIDTNSQVDSLPEKEVLPEPQIDVETDERQADLIRETIIKNVCPHLGLPRDPNTRPAFPSSVNRCFCSDRELPIALVYQSDYCIKENHRHCRVFKHGLKKPFPRMITRSASSRARKRRGIVWVLALAFLALFVLSALVVLIYITT